MNGIININKPEGPTSFGIVSSVRKITGVKRAGHAGTLDPAATGVLPVCLGRATRVTEYLMDATKDYRAEIEFGKTTDTYDGTGSVTSENDPSGVDLERIETALPSFLGEVQQVPPVYSALKQRGRPYYELARAGINVEIESRPVVIHSIEVLDWQPPVATVDITCGKGTYIRSLAHDLGQVLGCGAYMKSLVRRRYGPFSIDDAISPDDLKRAFDGNYWQNHIHPVDSVLLHLKAIVVNDDVRQKIRNGRSLERKAVDIPLSSSGQPSAEETPEALCRAYGLDGHFLGVLRFNPDSGQWQPEKVFI